MGNEYSILSLIKDAASLVFVNIKTDYISRINRFNPDKTYS